MRKRAQLLHKPRSSDTASGTLCIHLRGRDREEARYANFSWYKIMAARIATGRRTALAVANKLANTSWILHETPKALLISSPFPDIFSKSTTAASHGALLALPRVDSSSSMSADHAISNLMRLCDCSAIVSEETPRSSTYTLLTELVCGLTPCARMAGQAGASEPWMVLCPHEAPAPAPAPAPSKSMAGIFSAAMAEAKQRIFRAITSPDCSSSDVWRL